MEEFIAAAGVAALSGLTFLAYKHPKAYSRLYVAFLIIYGALWVAAQLFTLGVEHAAELAGTAGYKDAAALITKSVTPREFEQSDFIFFGVLFYLGFLLWLPDLIGKDEKKAA